MVNYKDYARKFLAECRDSLRQQSYPDFCVYIVDNASSEESRNFLRTDYPEAVVLPREDGNYAAANNAGLKKAREDGCEYLVIANMDIKFDEDWLTELVKAWEDADNPGMVQSKIMLYPQTGEEVKINSLGNIQHFFGFGFIEGYLGGDREIGGLPEIKGYASGCAFLTSKEIIEKIGEYDEEYWMYHDDLEMGWRVKLAGYKIYLSPRSVVYHKYEFGRSVRMLYYMERNRFLAILHYYKWPTLFLVLPALVAMDLGMIAYSIPGKWFGVKMRANLYFLKPSTWVKIIKKRRKIKKLRKVKDREVVKDFAGKVLFQEIDNPILKYIANPVFNLYWQIVKKFIIW